MNIEQSLSEAEWEVVRLFRRIDDVGQRIVRGTLHGYTVSFPRKVGAEIVNISEIRRAIEQRLQTESIHGHVR
ncbi:hypothetical protein [Undibacterium curvum]|uniref:Uncharacterized protein n=1 Tax=Undibacterium curvum TaxID=2762294 RepID=A0ABR7A508_9BURK|nr:hypothetical protein [Undibacterium curvum]MBC3931998.1 hypothetical protein [Undibacterium curvum]